MPCMCGDTMCPSCGPAQGYDPEYESIREWIEFDLLADLAASNARVDIPALAEDLTDSLYKQPEYVLDAISRRQMEWMAKYEYQNRFAGGK